MTSTEGLVALSNTAPLWIPALTGLAARLGATRTGRRIDASLKARFRWLSDPDAAKAFFEAFTAGTIRYEHDHADSASARAVAHVVGHIAEHGDGGLDQATILEQVFRNETNLSALEDVVHRYAWVLESEIVPLDEISESLRELIDDYLRPAFLQSPYFSTRVGFIEVIGLLRDIRDQLTEPAVDLASLESDYRSKLTEKYEYITMQGISPRVQNRTIGIKLRDIFIPVRAVQDLELTSAWTTSADDLFTSLWEATEITTGIEKLEPHETKAGTRTVISALNAALTESSSLSAEVYQEATPLHRSAANFLARAQAASEWPDVEQMLLSSGGTGKSGAVLALAQELGWWRNSTSPSEFLGSRRVVIQGHPGSGKSTLIRYVTWAAASGTPDIIGAATAQRTPVRMRAIDFGEALEGGSVTTLEEYLTEDAGRFAPVIKYTLLTGRAIILVDGLDEVGKIDLRARVAECVDDFLADPLFDDNAVVVTTRIVGYERSGLLGRLPHFTLSELTDGQISKFVQAWYQAIDAELPDAVDVAAERDRLLEAIARKPSLQRMARNPLLLTIITLIKWQGRALPDLRVLLYDVAAQTLIRSWPLTQRRVELDELLIREWLAPVALKIFADPTSDLIDEFSLMEELVASMQRLKPMTELEARRASRELLDSVSLHTGVLLPRGTDHDGRTLYGFLHQTFTEYFTAYLLAGNWEDGDLDLARYAHDPYWLEVILLIAGHLGIQRREKAGRFLKDLRNIRSSRYESTVHRDLLLTIEVLADGVPVGPGDFVEELLDAALRVWRATPFLSLRRSISELLQGLLTTEYGAAIARLVGRMHLDDHELLALAEQLGAENFIQELQNVLAHQDTRNKLRAARLLARAGDTGAYDVLSDLSQDFLSPVGIEATTELAELGDSRGIDLLLRLLEEAEGLPRTAHLSLEMARLNASIDNPRVLAALRKLLNSREAMARKLAARMLSRRRRLSNDELIAILREESQGGILLGARRLVDTEVGEQLRQLLRHQDSVIRLQAAWRLMAQGEPDRDALLPLLEDEAGNVRLRVASWFTRKGEPRALEALVSLLDEGTHLRFEAARILHGNGDVRGTGALRGLLSDPRPEIRVEAAAELADRHDSTVVNILVGALDHPDATMRRRAATAMASWQDLRAVKPLLELLRSVPRVPPNPREEDMLARWDDPRVTDILLEGLDADGKAATAIMRILARRADRRAIQALQELLMDERGDVRANAAVALLLNGENDEVRSIIDLNLDRILEDIQGQEALKVGSRRSLAEATYGYIVKYVGS
jgi:HEAT repeat protein